MSNICSLLRHRGQGRQEGRALPLWLRKCAGNTVFSTTLEASPAADSTCALSPIKQLTSLRVYCAPQEDCDPNELRDLLARAKAGDLPADYGGKGAKGRKSMDADP